jgi:hypothetical protein
VRLYVGVVRRSLTETPKVTPGWGLRRGARDDQRSFDPDLQMNGRDRTNHAPATIESKRTAPLGPFCFDDLAERRPFVRLRGAGFTAHAADTNTGRKSE